MSAKIVARTLPAVVAARDSFGRHDMFRAVALLAAPARHTLAMPSARFPSASACRILRHVSVAGISSRSSFRQKRDIRVSGSENSMPKAAFSLLQAANAPSPPHSVARRHVATTSYIKMLCASCQSSCALIYSAPSTTMSQAARCQNREIDRPCAPALATEKKSRIYHFMNS